MSAAQSNGDANVKEASLFEFAIFALVLVAVGGFGGMVTMFILTIDASLLPTIYTFMPAAGICVLSGVCVFIGIKIEQYRIKIEQEAESRRIQCEKLETMEVELRIAKDRIQILQKS